MYAVKKIKKKIYILYSFIGAAILYSGIMYLFPDVLVNNIEKFSSVESGNIRLLGTLQYLGLFDAFQWCFGVGLNQLSSFLQSFGLRLINDWGVVKNANYANAFVYMMLSYGVMGVFFFVRYIVQTVRTYKSDLGFVIYALGVFFSDQVLFNMNLLYVLTFLTISKQILAGDLTRSTK